MFNFLTKVVSLTTDYELDKMTSIR